MTNRKTLLEFPCEFKLKVFGHANIEFEGAVLSILNKYIPHLGESAIQTTPSKNDKYLSLSVTFQAENQAQLDNIYQALTDCEHVVMAL